MSGGQPEIEALDGFLDGLTRPVGVASAAEALVASSSEILYRRAAGFRVGGEPLCPGMRFDAASLTKPWMATLGLVLDQAGVLPLSTLLAEIFESPALARGAHTRGVSLDQLLRHTSGIAAWAPLAVRLGKRHVVPEALVSFLLSDDLWASRNEESASPAGSLYSDPGYILWGLAVEKATGRRLGALLDSQVCVPLGVASLGALAADPPAPVECRLDNGREVELAAEQGLELSPQRSFHLGVPQDGNARALGELCGHAGLFLTTDEQLVLGREWLRPGRVLNVAARDRALAGAGGHALGWARWSADGSSGPALSKSSFGHTGFTGGSLWIDPESDRLFVLLAHRLSSRIDFNPFRREFHRLAAVAF